MSKSGHSFPIASLISPEKLEALRVSVEESMKPEAKYALFTQLVQDSRKPFQARQYKKRIGSLPAKWLRQALNLVEPKKGEKLSKEHDECQAMVWQAVDEVLSNTGRALAAGSPRSIVEEMYYQMAANIAFWGGLIGQPSEQVVISE